MNAASTLSTSLNGRWKPWDEVRREVWREAYDEALQLAKEHHGKKGGPSADDVEAAMVKGARDKANEIKSSAYALGKAPIH